MAIIKLPTIVSNATLPPVNFLIPSPSNAEHAQLEPNTTPSAKLVTVNAKPQKSSTHKQISVNAQKTNHYGMERIAFPAHQEQTSMRKSINATTVQKVS